MTIESNIFKKYTPDFKKLKKYGFIKKKEDFIFEKIFEKGEFKAEIIISKAGEVFGRVFEAETNEEFLPLRVETQQGSYVGEIREEYKKILTEIRDNCFSKNYFISNQANRIAHLIISKYGDEPAFMWEKFPDYGVFKNSESSKWYGMIGDIDYSKLGKDNKNFVEILNIKLDKDEIQTLLKKDGFFPAWHMNKKSWITLTLDETLSDDLIMDLIEESYSYTIKIKKTKK